MTRPIDVVRLSMLRLKCWKLRRYLAMAERAKEIQRDGLLRRVTRNASSQFGRDHGFSGIRSIDDFRRQVPITDYEYHRPYVEQVMRGKVDALFPAKTRIWMFAQTSGTTSLPKHIPVTDRFYAQYKAGWQTWGTGVYRDYPQLFQKLTLQFSSHWRTSVAPDGTPCGNISGLAAETRPFYIASLFVLPSAVIRIHDHASKHYTALRLSLAKPNVGMIVTANPSTLIEVAKRADAEKESLIRDIHNGSLSDHLNVPGEVRRTLAERLTPNPARARQLDQMAERAGRLLPKDAWPSLDLLAVWTGGSVGMYLSQLPQYYGETAIRDHGISASEGRMTVPLANGCREGVLEYSSHFYEFIPESEHGKPDPIVLEAHELKPGEDYFILLTTDGGLYRYDIHDLVHCHGFEGQTPLLSFLNKGKNYTSFTGEKLNEHQVVEAMQRSCKELGIDPCTFTLAPSLDQRLQYHLVIAEGIQSLRGESLATEFQKQLATINHEYGDKCESGRILPIKTVTVPPDTWTKMREQKSSARGNFEEYKHPCLTSDLGFLTKIIQSNQTSES